jgi:hypothetical protein
VTLPAEIYFKKKSRRIAVLWKVKRYGQKKAT